LLLHWLALLLSLLPLRWLRLRLRLRLILLLLLLVLLTTEVTTSAATLPVAAAIASTSSPITLCASLRLVWDELHSASLESTTVRISAAGKTNATAPWLLCSIIGGVVDSDCAAIEPIFHQHVRTQGRTMIPLNVVHADKSIVGFYLVCEANESKTATSLCVSILYNNLPARSARRIS
jgi:hypothetical protein